jgi:hypothetical protein
MSIRTMRLPWQIVSGTRGPVGSGSLAALGGGSLELGVGLALAGSLA